MIMRRFTVVILRDDVIEGLIRKAKQEVHEIDAREKTSAARGVVLDAAVVRSKPSGVTALSMRMSTPNLN